MKKLVGVVLFLLLSSGCSAQSENFPKDAFAGKWVRAQQFNDLILKIKFENGKDCATVIDIGTGEAPPIIFHAKLEDNKLIISPQTHVNDNHIELEIKNKKLIFKYQLVIWDRNGVPSPVNKNRFLSTVYKKAK